MNNKRAGDMIVSKNMIFGAILFCILAIAPHILKVNERSELLDMITEGFGWYVYLVGVSLFISFVLGLFKQSQKDQ